MQTTLNGWRVFDSSPVLTYECSLRRWFADGFRNALRRSPIAAHGNVVDFTATPDAHRSLVGSA